ncbi:hypothetical protein Tco_0734021 [Tanacetum coccineum]
MSTSYITINSNSNDESTDSSISYIILSKSEVEDTTSLTALAPPSPDYVPALPDYAPVSDTKTESFEAWASLGYALGSDTKIGPFEEDHQEAEHDPKESS